MSSQPTWTIVRKWIDLIWFCLRVAWAGWQSDGQPSRRTPSLSWQQIVRRRLVTAGVFFAIWTLGIQARLYYLQVVSYEDLMARAAPFN